MESRPLPEDEKAPLANDAAETPNEDSHDGEFRLTVRKLELPVRPRGVLAD